MTLRRVEYEKLVEPGIVQPDEPSELIGGELMVAEPQGPVHYARVGLADYSVLDLNDSALEVCRAPAADPSGPFGWRSARCGVFDASARVTPLAAPGANIRVGDLLP